MIRAVFGDCCPGRRRRDEAGASAVEFALVLPIFLVVVFGCINYGVVFAQQISMNAGARDAARASVVQPLGGTAVTCAAVITQARDASATIGLATTRLRVNVTGPTGTTCGSASGSTSVTGSGAAKVCTGSSDGGQLVVSLSVTPQALVPLVPVPGSLSSTARFQCEYS